MSKRAREWERRSGRERESREKTRDSRREEARKSKVSKRARQEELGKVKVTERARKKLETAGASKRVGRKDIRGVEKKLAKGKSSKRGKADRQERKTLGQVKVIKRTRKNKLEIAEASGRVRRREQKEAKEE